MDEKEKITLYLNAIYQNAKTGMQSISDIITKTDDHALIEELAKEEDEYSVLAKECENFAKAEKIDNLKDNNWMEKANLWCAVNVGTMMDKSTRNIAEKVLLGTFMGIITCLKDKDDHRGVSAELDEILDNLYELERKNIDRLLPFLEENKKQKTQQSPEK